MCHWSFRIPIPIQMPFSNSLIYNIYIIYASKLKVKYIYSSRKQGGRIGIGNAKQSKQKGVGSLYLNYHPPALTATSLHP
jgi:hypothetical protein